MITRAKVTTTTTPSTIGQEGGAGCGVGTNSLNSTDVVPWQLQATFPRLNMAVPLMRIVWV